jgi:hypothetical protein
MNIYPRRLSQQGIGDLRKEALLRLGEIDPVNVIDEVGGSEIGELRISKLGSYISTKENACQLRVRSSCAR